jgi:hypothetical protein
MALNPLVRSMESHGIPANQRSCGARASAWRFRRPYSRDPMRSSNRPLCRLLAQMRSGNRARECPKLGGYQTYLGHRETDAPDLDTETAPALTPGKPECSPRLLQCPSASRLPSAYVCIHAGTIYVCYGRTSILAADVTAEAGLLRV